MASKAKAALLNGSLETPKESFVGGMIDDNHSFNENFEYGLSDDSKFLKNPIPSGLEEEKEEETVSEEQNKTEDETVIFDDSKFFKNTNFNETTEEVKEDEELKKDIEEEKEEKENIDEKSSTLEVEKPEVAPHRKRGRPKVIEDVKEEKQMPNNLPYDDIIKALANNLIKDAKNSDIVLNGLSKEQTQHIWDYILDKVNN